MPTASELPIDSNATAMDMANSMFGNGVSIVNASYSGATTASGIYSNGDTVAPGITPSDTGVILSTGTASDITNSSGDANAAADTSTDHGLAGDAGLSSVSGQETFDAAVFEADFIPDGDTLTMQIVFSSEEYLEYVNSGFNDAVGVWVNGQPAELSFGSGDISIDNINEQANENFYIDNPASGETYNTEMDGFTVTLSLKAPVVPGEVNSIKIGIADGGDGDYDSNLLIAGNSIQTALIAQDDDIEVTNFEGGEFNLLANDTTSSGTTLTITEINGQPVSTGDTVVLPTGEEITITPDGMVMAAPSGELGTNSFSYTVEDEAGNSDVAVVNMTTVAPCFTPGTRIETALGPRPVEQLKPGDLILTLDKGWQPLRWIGFSRMRAAPNSNPVVLTPGALGRHRRCVVSPNHRIVVASPIAELLFGTGEVFVPAKYLVNGKTILIDRSQVWVRYVHILFDSHQVVIGNGLPSESYHPGAQTLDSFDRQHSTALRQILPKTTASRNYGPTARRSLRRYEARLLNTCDPDLKMATHLNASPKVEQIA